MKKALRFISKNANFIVDIQIIEKVNENIYFGSIKTNCAQKFYLSNDLLILCSMLRKNISLFGTIKKIDRYINAEIQYFSEENYELTLTSGQKVSFDSYIDVDYEFFNEKQFENDLEIFEKQLDIFIQNNLILIQREA